MGLFFCANVQAEEVLQITLSDAINLALKNNRTIEQSAEDRESARWNLSAVRRNSGLRLTWNTSVNKIGGRYYGDYRAQRYQIDGMSETERQNYFSSYGKRYEDFPSYESETSNTLSLSIPIYTSGKLESQRKYAT
jgi:outer membrane protein TolC